jgi:hypothetical protein
MKIQFVYDWNKIGIAVTRGTPNREYRRVCDFCTLNEAAVYCQMHACYSCEGCIAGHVNARRQDKCHFISMAVARELATRAINSQPGRRFADNFFRTPERVKANG